MSRSAAFASAALRHLRDARMLARPSLDQAWHLVGFGPECALKACLSQEWQPRAVGHQTTLTGVAAEWILELDPIARRRGATAPSDPLQGWTTNVRYDRTGTAAASNIDIDAVIAVATQAVERQLADLWTSGDLEDDVLREGPAS